MKKIIFVICLLGVLSFELNAQEYKVITSVESIVSSGMGRSRIISALEDKDYKEFSSVQTDEDKTRNKSKRDEIRVKNFEETKLLNFFNIGGIRFQNIAASTATSSPSFKFISPGYEKKSFLPFLNLTSTKF